MNGAEYTVSCKLMITIMVFDSNEDFDEDYVNDLDKFA